MEKVEIKVDKEVSNKIGNIEFILTLLLCGCLVLGIGCLLIWFIFGDEVVGMVGITALLSAIPTLVLARLFSALECIIQTCEIQTAINKEKYTIKSK